MLNTLFASAALSGLAPASSRAPRVSMDAVSVLGPDDGIGDQTYMTQDDDLLDRRPTTATTATLAKASAPSKASTSSQQQHQPQPLKSALKKPSTGAASASKAGASSAPASAPKGRITVAQKKKREVCPILLKQRGVFLTFNTGIRSTDH